MAGGNGVLGKDDFLNLMIAQLKNQDPLSPLDGTEFAAQLAQFSSLEQLANLNESVSQSVDANFLLIQSVNNTMTANLIGKSAKIGGNELEYKGQDSVQFGFTLPSNAKNVTVNIYDDQHNLIKTINNLPGNAGDHKLSWDFTDNNGEKISEGKYTVEVKADDAIDGSSLNVGVFTIGKIDGIKFTDSGTKLLIDGIEYDLGSIMEIIETANKLSGREPKWQL
ncbi:MAG: flagellar hook capping protein [Ignavibacteria bacterium]|nr:MAG: flagellar hook capping protein [Ignavibacteria bacterium]